MTPLFKLFIMLVAAFLSFTLVGLGYWLIAILPGALAWFLAGTLAADFLSIGTKGSVE